jgi:hypothetical protein
MIAKLVHFMIARKFALSTLADDRRPTAKAKGTMKKKETRTTRMAIITDPMLLKLELSVLVK